MKTEYKKGEKVLVYSNGTLKEYVVFSDSVNNEVHLVVPESDCQGYVFVFDKEIVCKIEQLRILHNELENLMLMDKSEILEKIFRNAELYSLLFQIENFLCENDRKSEKVMK